MQKVITRLTLFRRGLKRFEQEVNSHLLTNDWDLEEIRIVKIGLIRILCVAVLIHVGECKGECK